MPLKRKLQEAEKLKDIATISALIQTNLPMEEMTPLANTMNEAGTSSQAVREAEEKEEES